MMGRRSSNALVARSLEYFAATEFAGASAVREAARTVGETAGSQTAFAFRSLGVGNVVKHLSYPAARLRAEQLIIGAGLVVAFLVFAVAAVLIHPSLAGIAPG